MNQSKHVYKTWCVSSYFQYCRLCALALLPLSLSSKIHCGCFFSLSFLIKERVHDIKNEGLPLCGVGFFFFFSLNVQFAAENYTSITYAFFLFLSFFSFRFFFFLTVFGACPAQSHITFSFFTAARVQLDKETTNTGAQSIVVNGRTAALSTFFLLTLLFASFFFQERREVYPSCQSRPT